MDRKQISHSVNLLVEHFKPLVDPRRRRTRVRHPLLTILVMALCATIGGADGWDQVAAFCRFRQEWFSGFLDMPAGTPCADTFRRVFERLVPERFQECFASWVGALAQPLKGETVAFDGKTLRGVVERWGKHNQLHLVHAWATQQQLLLAQQLAPAGAADEIAAIPRLLQLLDVKGAVVTADANGCTAPITRAITDAGADYVLAVKGNRGRFHRHIVDAFEGRSRFRSKSVERDRGHGRDETRTVCALKLDDWPWQTKNNGKWAGLQTAVKVIRTRKVGDQDPTTETHFYVSSLPPDAAKIARIIRDHWGIENRLHWSLDVSFNDDDRPIRDRVAAQNLATLTRISMTLLKREATERCGLAAKRKLAGWSNDYLTRALLSANSIA